MLLNLLNHKIGKMHCADPGVGFPVGEDQSAVIQFRQSTHDSDLAPEWINVSAAQSEDPTTPQGTPCGQRGSQAKLWRHRF